MLGKGLTFLLKYAKIIIYNNSIIEKQNIYKGVSDMKLNRNELLERLKNLDEDVSLIYNDEDHLQCAIGAN